MRPFIPLLTSALSLAIITTQGVAQAPPAEAQKPDAAPRLSLYRSRVPADLHATRFVVSDWMSAALTFSGSGFAGYLNLTVGGVWVVQNVPVVAERDGVPETRWFAFGPGAGVARGTGPVAYGFTLAAAPRDAAPGMTGQTAPAPQPVVMCGRGGGPGNPGSPGALIGGEIAPGETAHAQKDFPNQEAKLMECGPVAISNSLQWLKKTKNLDVPDSDITPDALDVTLGWDPKKNGLTDGWLEKKKKKFGKLIDTSTKGVDQLGQAMDDGCDIELEADTHIAAIVGVTKLNTGKWSIDVAHDTDQGKAGGTKTETIIYSPGDSRIKGGTFLDGTKVSNFIVECKLPDPKKPAR